MRCATTVCHAMSWTHRTHKSIWVNESSVNPKSTSNQSSKPCTVLQYPSKKVCNYRMPCHVLNTYLDAYMCVWHDLYMCVWHDSYMCVWHDLYMCVCLQAHHACMWVAHDAYMCTTWPIPRVFKSESCLIWRSHVSYELSHVSNQWVSCEGSHVSYMCVTWPIPHVPNSLCVCVLVYIYTYMYDPYV